MCAAIRSTVRPAANWPGQRTKQGTRMPPSWVLPFALEHPGVVTRLLRPVIGQKDYDRMFTQLEFVQFPQEPAYVLVDVFHHPVDPGRGLRVETLRKRMPRTWEIRRVETHLPVGLIVLFRHLKRCVRRIEGKVSEERPARGSAR